MIKWAIAATLLAYIACLLALGRMLPRFFAGLWELIRRRAQ